MHTNATELLALKPPSYLTCPSNPYVQLPFHGAYRDCLLLPATYQPMDSLALSQHGASSLSRRRMQAR